MNEDKKDKEPIKVEKSPDEYGNVIISSHIKIFDPTTKEEFLNKRDD